MIAPSHEVLNIITAAHDGASERIIVAAYDGTLTRAQLDEEVATFAALCREYKADYRFLRDFRGFVADFGDASPEAIERWKATGGQHDVPEEI